ncbi:hypothetical protein ILUMI_23189, partial [Ignelater luminosus]
EAPSKAAGYRWYAEFQRGRISLGKQYGGGPSNTAVIPENIDVVRKLIMEERHVTYREIQRTLGISGTAVQKILHQELGPLSETRWESRIKPINPLYHQIGEVYDSLEQIANDGNRDANTKHMAQC